MSERQARGRIASMCETVMRCVIELEKSPANSEVCAKLRMSVMRATD